MPTGDSAPAIHVKLIVNDNQSGEELAPKIQHALWEYRLPSNVQIHYSTAYSPNRGVVHSVLLIGEAK